MVLRADNQEPRDGRRLFWRGRRVFVTGHTGFKGAWLSKILETAGAAVTGYALEPPTKPNLFDILQPDIRSIIGDIRDYDSLSSAMREAAPEVVFHMAAQPLVLESYKKPAYTYETNVMGTVNLLECVRQAGGVKSLLNVTTDKVYLNRDRAEGYREDEQLGGYDPYANSKSCCELVTESYKNSFLSDMGVAVSTARSGNVIGGGDFAENRIIPDCVKATTCGEVIKIRNPKSVRPFQHVLDTLFAYLLIAKRQHGDAAYAGNYNIGPDAHDCRASGELATMFCKAWGDGAVWEGVSVDAPREDTVLTLDCGKIARVLGWRQRWDIKTAIEETVAWYRAFYSGGDARGFAVRQIERYEEAL
ncbi:MAG: CDP-glucose 4,6-dehydratase [Oscillospiraceae bacterium]|jgi:CDP-glucose 4,6-dehydratase|nr:CDP-glucose 4,6-dehydratase [Oscillospiraceae bacterium]